MDLQPQASPSNCARDLPREGGIGVEAGDLVLVLVGHQLEQVARDRLGEPARLGACARLGGPRPLDQGAVSRRVGGVLVGGEEGDAPRDDLVEASATAAAPGRPSPACVSASTAARVDRGAAAPAEGGDVHRDRVAVELDRPLDRGRRRAAARRSGRRSRA